MGKKKRNQKKRQKNGKNVLQNSSDKKASSVLNKDDKKEEISKNCCSLEAQNKLPNILLSNPNSVLSNVEVSKTLKSNPKVNNKGNAIENYSSPGNEVLNLQLHENIPENLNAANISCSSHDTERNKLSGKTCNTSFKVPESGNHCLPFTDIHQTKAVTLFPYETPKSDLTEKFPASYSQKSKPFSESDDDYPTSYSPVKESVITQRIKPNSGFQSSSKELNDRLNFSRNLREESSGSDEEYSTSDFFKPVFDDWYESKNNMSVKKKLCGTDDKSIYLTETCCAGSRNSEIKPIFEDDKFKDTISCSVHVYKSSKDYFSEVYHTWFPERMNTLQKLKTLKTEVHDDQLNFNKSQGTFRELGLMSRKAKTSDNQVIDFVASFTAFLSDAASGMVSVAQAFNVDSYQSKFKEIMEHDANITQKLYKARSQCVAKYHDIEEVMRNFHSDNFSSTIGKISNALEVEKYWEGMKEAYKKDNMPQLLDVVSKFFDNACQSSKVEEVSDSIEQYVDDNPAALDAFKSAGRATYAALDTWKLNRSQNNLLKGIDVAANHMLMLDDTTEIQRLKSTVEEDSPQSKVESQIEQAIDSLESELSEINRIYFELFESHVESDDSDCDIYSSY